MTADVAVPAVDGVFSYRVPASLALRCAPGMRVLVPFGNRRVTGFVTTIMRGENPRATRSIEFLLDDSPVFSHSMIEFTHWMSDYYLCPWGEALKAALPAGISLDEKRLWTLTKSDGDAYGALARQYGEPLIEVVEALRHTPLTGQTLRRRFHLDSSSPVMRQLRKHGIVDFRPMLRPPTVKTRYESIIRLSHQALVEYDTTLLTRLRSVHQQQLIREVREHGPDGVPRGVLMKGANSSRTQALAKLIELNLLSQHKVEATRWDPKSESIPHTTDPQQLTTEQMRAVGLISEALHTARRDVFLLFGVTGSGKTQVYIEAIRNVLQEGRTALVLLPEIALTPFVWGRFYRAFGDQVAIQHSAQSPAVRYDLWRRIREGKYPVVIGARSAVFAPLSNLGLVVIDEEQETSYKQSETEPRYHARDAALMRARMEHAVAILGSATPSVESLHHALTGKYKLLELPNRVGGAVMPKVEIIQWKDAIPESDVNRGYKPEANESVPKARTELPAISTELSTRIETVLGKRRQVILLQNRRGYSPFLLCRFCGHLFMCPNCSVSLTFHKKGDVLRCHYCDHRDGIPDRCTQCGTMEITRIGLGTQRLEDELRECFPTARILRMDSDTTMRQGEHGKMVSAFSNGEYDILVGTQMIAKGLDFPGVDLAAIARADAEFFFPDFRATERGTALALQLAGRAGRRDGQGTVVIQTAVPEHPAMQTVVSGDWRSFVEKELVERNAAGFPPFTRLVLIRSLARDESSGIRALLKLRRRMSGNEKIEILGPAPAVILKVEKKYRFHMIIRSRREIDPSGSLLRDVVRQAIKECGRSGSEPGVALEIDVDPVSVA